MTEASPTSAPAPPDGGAPLVKKPERPAKQGLRSAIEWIAILGGALLVALVVKTFLIQAFYIPSASMEPTLKQNDRVLVNKLSYRLHDINRGDIVVFERPGDDGTAPEIKDLIKRVIALPGETVEGRGGKVFIDGKPLDEPYLAPGTTTAAFDEEKVPADHVWVMGDNRGNSKDSRVFGPIPESIVVGRAFIRVWPLGDLTLL